LHDIGDVSYLVVHHRGFSATHSRLQPWACSEGSGNVISNTTLREQYPSPAIPPFSHSYRNLHLYDRILKYTNPPAHIAFALEEHSPIEKLTLVFDALVVTSWHPANFTDAYFFHLQSPQQNILANACLSSLYANTSSLAAYSIRCEYTLRWRISRVRRAGERL
jgi:hypothetical protein